MEALRGVVLILTMTHLNKGIMNDKNIKQEFC